MQPSIRCSGFKRSVKNVTISPLFEPEDFPLPKQLSEHLQIHLIPLENGRLTKQRRIYNAGPASERDSQGSK